MLDPRFVDEITAAWLQDEMHKFRQRVPCPLPPRWALAKFINEMFMLTLRLEEGVALEISCAICSLEQVPRSTDTSILPTIEFVDPIEFIAAKVAKIAPAFDPDLTTLIVVWDVRDHSLLLHSVARHASKRDSFVGTTHSTQGNSGWRPDRLTITLQGPAAFSVSRSRSLIGTLQSGYFTPAKPSPFAPKSLGAHLLRISEADALYQRFGADYWHALRETIQLLLEESRLRGCGSTIVILPLDDKDSYYPIALKYRLSDSISPRAAIEHALSSAEAHDGVLNAVHRKTLQQAVQRLAQLSTVDGALILNCQLGLVGFGATLSAAVSNDSAIIGPDYYGNVTGTEFQIERYGTRHRSAFNLVSAVPDSIAFVISQDGPIRALRRASEGVVHVWPVCDVSMFI